MISEPITRSLSFIGVMVNGPKSVITFSPKACTDNSSPSVVSKLKVVADLI